MVSLLNRKKQSRVINEILIEVSEKHYCNISKVDNVENKFLLINTVSEISNTILDFYIDLCRTNNVFYYNINQITTKLVKEIFILNSAFYLYNYIEDKEKNVELIKNFFYVFKFSRNDKRLFYKYLYLYENDVDKFKLEFTKVFSKKIFSSKQINKMEFLYINHYLETSLEAFRHGYSNFLLEA